MPTSNPANQITTKDTVKLFLGITASTDDALLTKMCDWLTAFVQSYCQKKFIEETITEEIYNSKDFKFSLFLDNAPLSEMTKLERRVSDTTWETLVVNEDYEINLTTGFIRFFQIDTGVADIRATYKTFGNIPADIEMIATQLVARAYNKRKSQGVSQESLGEASIQWGNLLTDDDKAVLNNHRRFTSIIA
jgi:hypothetical protein